MTRPLFIVPKDNSNLLTGKPRAGTVPAPTPAEHVLLAQVALERTPRQTNPIDRALDALGPWLAKAYLPLPHVRSVAVYVWRQHRMPRTSVRRLVPYGLFVVASLPFLAVEWVWRVGA